MQKDYRSSSDWLLCAMQKYYIKASVIGWFCEMQRDYIKASVVVPASSMKRHPITLPLGLKNDKNYDVVFCG
jgi:hypothetical protein